MEKRQSLVAGITEVRTSRMEIDESLFLITESPGEATERIVEDVWGQAAALLTPWQLLGSQAEEVVRAESNKKCPRGEDPSQQKRPSAAL